MIGAFQKPKQCKETSDGCVVFLFGLVFVCLFICFISVVMKVLFEEVTFKLKHQLSKGRSRSDTERIAFQAGEAQVQRS